MQDFIRISKEEFEEFLKQYSGSLTKTYNGVACEFIYDIPTTKDDIIIRIYSSISVNTYSSRAKGTDAIRSVLFDLSTNTAITNETRTHRRVCWEKNLNTKIKNLLFYTDNLNYCEQCGSIMKIKKGVFGEFLGCIRYPGCTHTCKI